MVTIIFPVLNEVESLKSCVSQALAETGSDTEVVIVDNGSTDGSLEIAERLSSIYDNVRLVKEERKGYGRAIRTGLEAAKGNMIIICDADGTYDLSSLPAMITELTAFDVVIGRRVYKDKDPHKFGAELLSKIARDAEYIPVKDFHCGMRGLNRRALANCEFKTDGFEFATEFIVRLYQNGCSFGEIPIQYRPKGTRIKGKSKLHPIRDGFRHLSYILKGSKNENK